MKKSELSFAVASIVIDFFMILLAGIVAYFVRFQTFVAEFRPVIYTMPIEQYLGIIVPMSMGWLVLFALAGLYDLHGRKKFSKEFSQILLGCSTGILVVILIIFFRKEELFSSRFIVLAVWILSIITVLLGRVLLYLLKQVFYKHGYGVHRVMVVGNDKTTNLIMQGLNRGDGLGFKLSKHYKNFNHAANIEIESFIRNRLIDDIFVADPNFDKKETLALKNLCDEFHCTFRYAADLFDAQATNVEIITINDVPIIEIKRTPLDGWGRIVKRGFDFFGSLFALILLAPIFIVVAIAMKFDSSGPIIYKNQRVSKDGNFFVYKFRTMYREYCTGPGYSQGDAEKIETELIKEKSERHGPAYKVLNDPRRTPVGRFLERTSIDELPQFFNVFLGNMSMVGPRPHQPREVAKYEKHHKRVLSIKPGITGLAQISGRSDLDFDDEVRLDTYYIENWSIGYDLSIIMKTPFIVLSRRKRV